MLFSSVRSCSLPWPLPQARIWVLIVVLAGMLASSAGMVKSHGIAALAFVQHGHESADNHGQTLHTSGDDAAAEESHLHAHHAADHSHDNAHVSPLALGSVARLLPDWHPFAPSRIKGQVANRLDRPPMP